MKWVEASPYFAFAFICLVILIAGVSLLYPQEPVHKFSNNISSPLSLSWNDILKLFFVDYGMMIILMICAAWIVNGVGFHIIKG